MFPRRDEPGEVGDFAWAPDSRTIAVFSSDALLLIDPKLRSSIICRGWQILYGRPTACGHTSRQVIRSREVAANLRFSCYGQDSEYPFPASMQRRGRIAVVRYGRVMTIL